MRSSTANVVWLRGSAVMSLVCWGLVCYGTSEYLRSYKMNLGPPSERDVWEGGDVVQAIKQRAQTAALHLQGFAFSLAIILLGAVAQSLLAFRQTKDVPTAIRSFCQVELVYQAVKGHQTGSKTLIAERTSKERAAQVVRMSNCCIFFLLGLLGYMVSFIVILQRPLRATVTGRDLGMSQGSMQIYISLLCALYIGVTAAQHLGGADWSFWRVRPKAQQPQRLHGNQQPEVSSCPDQLRSASRSTTPDSTVAKVDIEDQNIGPRQVLKGVIRIVACFVSVLSHLYVYLLMSVAIRGFILCIVIGHWILSSLVYYAVSRQIASSLFWGFLSHMLHIGFNRTTHRKAWWVAVATSMLFSGVGIACGVLQMRLYVFTQRYATAQYTGGTNTLGHVSFERDVGLSALAAAGADLLVQTTLVLVHMRHGDADKYEAQVQTPNIV